MKKTVNIKFSALAVLAGAVLISAGPVYAHDGEDHSGSTSTKIEIEQRSSSVSSTQSDSNGRKSFARSEVRQEVKVDGAAMVAELRKERKAQSAEARQKKCESRKQGLNTKFERLVANSQRVQDRISGILDKAVQYQQDNNLTIDTGLVPAAQAAQTKSADSITSLLAVKPSLDCNNASVAEDVATFKAAAQTTRENLKAYRSAVKAVLQALLAAQPAQAEEDNQ